MKAARLRLLALCALVVAALGVRSALAMLGRPTSWPIDRVQANVERYVASHPEVAQGHYCLGRIHAYTFVHDTARLAMHPFGPNAEVATAALDSGSMTLDELARMVLKRQREEGARNAPEAQLAHLSGALASLRRAIALAPTRGEFHLTLAYVLEHGSHLAAAVGAAQALDQPLVELDSTSRIYYERLVRELGDAKLADAARARLWSPSQLWRALPLLDAERASPDARRQANATALLGRAWLDAAIGHYREAFVLALESDREEELVNDDWELTSLEAGEAYLRLGAERPELAPDDAFAASVREGVAELRKKPLLSSVTPILLSLDGCRPLADLVTPARTVLFDLDGDLVVEPWPWPAPSTGWLVWDPKHEGRIESGRDLFGSASAWLFFPDGYRVLDALDDDRSGELRGPELTGIAVWFDRDTDGVSDRGEVVPVEELGIVALATESTLTFERSPANLCGLELADGRVLPTYDWVLAPVAP